MTRYFLKLTNNEKLEISFEEFIDFQNHINTTLKVKRDLATLFIHYNQILFGYIYEGEDEEDNY